MNNWGTQEWFCWKWIRLCILNLPRESSLTEISFAAFQGMEVLHAFFSCTLEFGGQGRGGQLHIPLEMLLQYASGVRTPQEARRQHGNAGLDEGHNLKHWQSCKGFFLMGKTFLIFGLMQGVLYWQLCCQLQACFLLFSAVMPLLKDLTIQLKYFAAHSNTNYVKFLLCHFAKVLKRQSREGGSQSPGSSSADVERMRSG